MLLALLTALALLEPSEPPRVEAAPSTERPSEPSEAVPEPPDVPELPDVPEADADGDADGPTDVRWAGPEGCPPASSVRRGIERRLGRTLATDEVQVDGTVVAIEEGFSLDLRTTAGELTDTRTLEAARCESLADATALVVALAVDPVAVAEVIQATRSVPIDEAPPVLVEPSEPATPSEPAASGEPATPSEPADAREPEPTRGLEGGVLRATAGVGLGATPGVTGALSLAGGLQWRRARLEVLGSYWIPRRTAPLDGATVAVQLGAAGVRGCGQIRRDRIEAPLCAGVLVGGMRGDGRGVPGSRTALGPWVAIEAAVGLSWWVVPRWALAGGFSAAIPVVQPAFEVGDEEPVRLFEPSPVAGRLWVGVETRLGRRR